jgi:hypothetical protein
MWLNQCARWPAPLRVQACERKATGYGLISQASRAGRPLYPLEPGTQDKLQRATDWVVMAQNGTFYVLEGAAWRPAFDEEVLTAPGADHMDQFDICAYAAILVARGGLLGRFVEGDLLVWGPGDDIDAKRELAMSGVVTVCGIEVDFGDD